MKESAREIAKRLFQESRPIETGYSKELELRDQRLGLLARIRISPDGRQEARDRHGTLVGRFDGRKTVDRWGRSLEGNRLLELIIPPLEIET